MELVLRDSAGTVSVYFEDHDEPFSQSFSFTIFPHHITMLRSQTEE